MYDRETVRSTNALFFTSFGKYMVKYQSVTGSKVNWINYNTGVKNIYFRLEVDQHSARVFIDLQHKDEDIRELFYEQFLALKTVFHSIMEIEWNWNAHFQDETGCEKCRIYIELNDVNIFDKSTWKKVFKFYEKYLLKLDEFWIEFKALFLQMQ